MIRKSETADGWIFKIDNTGQAVRLNIDELYDLCSALETMLDSAKVQTACRAKWKQIVDVGYSLCTDGRHAHVQRAPDGELFLQMSRNGKPLCMPLDQFILCLRKEDRPKATAFLTSVATGRW